VVGRTVRPLLADRPPGRRRLSARLGVERGSTGCSGTNNGLSAPGRQTVWAPRRPSAWAPWTVRRCPARVGPRSRDANEAGTPFSSPTRPRSSLFLSLSCSLSRKDTPLGDFVWGTPRTVRARSRTLREVLHHVIRVFFRTSHSLYRILSKKVVRVW
jgi:hypothetical protein